MITNNAAPMGPHVSKEQLVEELLARAEAMSTFAVNVGLISPGDALEIIKGFAKAHPELQRNIARG